MHIVAAERLGVPQDGRHAFTLLRDGGVIDDNLTVRLQAMVGFRNIAIHQYQDINVTIVQRILEERLGDFTEFTRAVLSR